MRKPFSSPLLMAIIRYSGNQPSITLSSPVATIMQTNKVETSTGGEKTTTVREKSARNTANVTLKREICIPLTLCGLGHISQPLFLCHSLVGLSVLVCGSFPPLRHHTGLSNTAEYHEPGISQPAVMWPSRSSVIFSSQWRVG